MAHYDNFHKGRAQATGLGLRQARRHKQWMAELIERFASRPKSGANKIDLLEIGPGAGVFAHNFGDRFNYEAVEANDAMAKNLRAEGFTVHIERLPGMAVTKKYAAVYLDQVFEHLGTTEQQFVALQEIYDALAEGGIVVIGAPDYTVWKEHFFDGDYTHNAITTLNRTEQMFFDIGFESVFTGYATFGLRGRFITGLLGCLVKAADACGLLHLAGQPRRMKIIASFLRSFVIVGRKNASD